MSLSEDRKTRISYTDVILKHDGKWLVERTTDTRVFSELFRKWEKQPQKKEWLPLSTFKPELQKQVETWIVYKKEAVSTYSLEPMSAFFKQKIKVKVEKDSDFYLNVFEGQIFLQDLEHRVCQAVGIVDRAIERIGKPERITLKEATALAESGIKVYSESPRGELSVRFNF